MVTYKSEGRFESQKSPSAMNWVNRNLLLMQQASVLLTGGTPKM